MFWGVLKWVITICGPNLRLFGYKSSLLPVLVPGQVVISYVPV